MKRTITAILVAMAAGTAAAQSFDFQLQFGSEEYVPGHDAAHMTFAPVERSPIEPSVFAVYRESNVDGIALNQYSGEIVKSGPSRISLYEVMRDSPEGVAYSDYHARYPADTDWDRVAREYRDSQRNNGLASGIESDPNRS